MLNRNQTQTVLDALQDALEIADAATRSVNWPEANHAMVILQAALAEPSEAVAWMHTDRTSIITQVEKEVNTFQYGSEYLEGHTIPLFTHPAPSKPEPSEPVARAWAEGYKSGVEDERTSEANIGIAGFDMKVNPARNNPYGRPAPQAALAEPSEPVGEIISSGPADFPIFQWISADHSLRCKTGDLLYLHPSKPDKDLIQALTERDEYHDVADKLAEGIALHFDGDIGEHSSSNSPWDRALDLLDSAACAETMRLSKPAPLPKLTDDEITEVVSKTFNMMTLPYDIKFARAILAAAREKAK